MQIDNILNNTTTSMQTFSNKNQVINETQIKSILYLGIKGDIKITPKNDNAEGITIDTFA